MYSGRSLIFALLLLSATLLYSCTSKDTQARTTGALNGPSSPPGQPQQSQSQSGIGQFDLFEYEEWNIVPFVDPRDGASYEFIDGRVIIAFKDPPNFPQMHPNYFDQQLPANDPFYQQLNYTSSMNQSGQVIDPQIASFMAAENLTAYSEWAEVRGMAFVLPAGQTVADAVANWPGEYPNLIDVVDPDAILESCAFPQTKPTDDLYDKEDPDLWHTMPDKIATAPYPAPTISAYSSNATSAWGLGSDYLGYGAIVAVLDTGVDFGNPDLQANSVSIGINTGDKKESTTYLPRSLGGGEPWDWLMERSQGYATGLGHGTIVAGIICAESDNDPDPDPPLPGNSLDPKDTLGVAPASKYLPIAIKRKGLPDGKSKWSMSAMLNALSALGGVKGIFEDEIVCDGETCLYIMVEIANMSFGTWGKGNEVGNRQLDILGRYILFCSSAGSDNNGSNPYWPASHANCFAIGSHDVGGHRSTFSNYQGYVRISAPGSDIRTTDMVGYTSNGFFKGRMNPVFAPFEITEVEGTSFSSPVASAVAGILLGNEYQLTPTELSERMVSTSKELFPGEWVNVSEIGGVDAYAASTGGTP